MPLLDPLFPPEVELTVTEANYIEIDSVVVKFHNNNDELRLYTVEVTSVHQFSEHEIEINGEIILIKLGERPGSPWSLIELVMEDDYTYEVYRDEKVSGIYETRFVIIGREEGNVVGQWGG